MRQRLRSHLTYANVISTLCLFMLLGGAAYAATKISGGQIKNESVGGKKLKDHSIAGKKLKDQGIAGKKLKDDTVTGTQIDESTLKGLMADQIDIVFNEGPDNPGTQPGGIPQVVDVSCPTGERAIGGGGAWIIPNFADNDTPTALNAAWISASMPIPARPGTTDATGWRVAGRNITGTNRHLRAYAVCVKQKQ